MIGKGNVKKRKFCVELGATGQRDVYVFARSESDAKATIVAEISSMLGGALKSSELSRIADAPIREVEVIGPRYNL